MNNLHSSMYKPAQSSNSSPAILPPQHCLLYDLLKSLETALQNKQIVTPPSCAFFTPLWFVAETERNIFLWRSGHSLAHAADFQFWIDLDELIDKRIDQLQNSDSNSPFVNSLWGVCPADSAAINAEVNYLYALKEQTAPIFEHIAGLSMLGAVLSDSSNNTIKPRIILPIIRPGRINLTL